MAVTPRISLSPTIPHKNSETALFATPFTDKAMLLVCCEDISRENNHFDLTLLRRGRGINILAYS